MAKKNKVEEVVQGAMHVPELPRGVYTVGNLSYHDLSYKQGPSKWTQQAAIVSKEGEVINIPFHSIYQPKK